MRECGEKELRGWDRSSGSYLGCLMQRTGEKDKAGLATGRGWQTFHKLKPNILSPDQQLPGVRAVLTYGAAETRVLTHTQ